MYTTCIQTAHFPVSKFTKTQHNNNINRPGTLRAGHASGPRDSRKYFYRSKQLPITATDQEGKMDYIKDSSFPILASTNCSPTKENFSYPTAFDKTYLRDPFTGTDAPLAAFECFGRPLSPKTATESLNTTSSVAPIGPLLETPLVHHSFYRLNPVPYRFPWDANPFPAITDFDLNLSVLSENSHTPSLYDDAPQPSTPASPP
jgi:hypothetical protein